MTKEREILTFLYNNFFNKLLSLESMTDGLKKNVEDNIRALNDRSAEGMIRYFWSNMAGEETKKVLGKRLEDEGFVEFDKVIEEFKIRFDDAWLRGEKKLL